MVNANPSHEYRCVKLGSGKLCVSSLFPRIVVLIKPKKTKTNKDTAASDGTETAASDEICTGLNEEDFQLVSDILSSSDNSGDNISMSFVAGTDPLTDKIHQTNQLTSDTDDFILLQEADESETTITPENTDNSALLQETNESETPITPAKHDLTEDDLAELRRWVSQDKANKEFDTKNLRQSLSNANSLYRFTNPILKEIIRWLKYKYPNEKIKLSGNKVILVGEISRYLCPSDQQELDPEIVYKRPSKASKVPESLRAQSIKYIDKKFDKFLLSVCYASFLFQERIQEWKQQSSVSFKMKVSDEPINWFYILDRHPETGDVLVSTVDHHHLFIRLRMALVRGTLTTVSVSRFVDVANAGSTPLTRGIIVDGLEPQSEDFARITFSQQVEDKLRQNGAIAEAEFCRVVRNWNRANDEPGMSAMDRVRHRLEFRRWLLTDISFSDFPPDRGYIKGIPSDTFEAVVAAIDGYILLHSLIPNHSYNVRSVNTNDNETYHSIIYSLSNTKYGIPDCSELEALQARIWNCHRMKLDPEMPFQIRTAKKPTYIDRKRLLQPVEDDPQHDKGQTTKVTEIKTIEIKDHFFDTNSRTRAKPRHKRKGISKWLEPAKGVRGVREYHKVDESQLSALSRMGLADQIEE